MIFSIYAQVVSRIPCRHFILCKVASKTKHFILADILVLVGEILVVVILSEWWLFYQSGGRGRPLWAHPCTYILQPIWKFLGCGNIAARLLQKQACNNLALACTQYCDHPLQGAHNLAKIVYKLYNLA